MIGFIKKDLAMIKGNMKVLVILFIVYVAMGFASEMNISFILPFMSVMIMLSTFSYDDFNKWDAYAITLPDGRKNSVRAKYLTTFLIVLVVTILVMFFETMISYVHNNTIDFENVLLTVPITMLSTLLVEVMMYPAIYKWGIEKARIGIFGVVFGIEIVGSLLIKLIDFSKIASAFSILENYGLLLFMIGTLLSLVISYKISLKIYQRKEF